MNEYCGNCGIELSKNSLGILECYNYNQGINSYHICGKCHERHEKSAVLAQQIIDGTAPATTPDFGTHCEMAVKMACAMFPSTFRLRNHEGTFRVSQRASYVSQGRVMVYTQRLKTTQVQNGPARGQYQDEWVDFAKGTISELKGQVVR